MNPVQMAAKLYEARDAVKFLYDHKDPAKYQQVIEEHQGFIRMMMEKEKCGEVAAATKLCRMVQEKYPSGGEITQLCLMAACVEIVEPSIVTVR